MPEKKKKKFKSNFYGFGIMVFNATFSYIMAISFIGGGNQSARRKPLTCRKSLTNNSDLRQVSGFLKLIYIQLQVTFSTKRSYCN
jgi:hypothetical protein